MKTHSRMACAVVLFAALAVPGITMARGSRQSTRSYGGSPVHVRSYVRHDGRLVSPYLRTAPNHTKLDNWSTRGNSNPYTGKVGTKAPF
jgi:hypothetical protein